MIYKLGIHEKAFPAELSWVNRLKFAKQAGFDFMEISIDGSDERIARLDDIDLQAKTINEAVKTMGLPIGSISVSALRRFALGSVNREKRERAMDIAIKSINLASLLGCRIVQIAGLDVCYEESTEETKRYFQENLQVLANYAASERVLVGVEPMEKDFMDNVSKAVDCVLPICSPYIGIYPDTSGLTASALKLNNDIVADFEKGKGHILALHLQEFMENNKSFVPVGEGIVKFNSFLNVAMQLGIRSFVVEYVCPLDLNWSQEVARCCKFFREKIEF